MIKLNLLKKKKKKNPNLNEIEIKIIPLFISIIFESISSILKDSIKESKLLKKVYLPHIINHYQINYRVFHSVSSDLDF